jgi:hypothetical protein
MRSTVPLLLAPLLLAGCTNYDASPDAAARETAAAVGQKIACIDSTRIAGRRAVDNRTLVFEMSGGQVFRNDLEETCPGIARASNFGTLAIDPIESRMCRGDMVRVYDPADVRDPKTAPRCRLGAFARVADRQQ